MGEWVDGVDGVDGVNGVNGTKVLWLFVQYLAGPCLAHLGAYCLGLDW